jgi:hypothetical protein
MNVDPFQVGLSAQVSSFFMERNLREAFGASGALGEARGRIRNF